MTSTTNSTTTTSSDAGSPYPPSAASPVPLTAGDGEVRLSSSLSIEEGDATEPTAKATTAAAATTAPDPASDAAAELEEGGQAPAEVVGEGEEEMDLSDLMTLLFQHLRTDEGHAEFQALSRRKRSRRQQQRQ